MQSIFRGDDGGFNRFQQGAPRLAPERYGSQNFQHLHQTSRGGMREIQQQQQEQQQQNAQEHTQEVQQARRMQPSVDLRHRGMAERGDFSRPHRMAASHDSNDDDGETSSASEDSMVSAGYPSPPQATETGLPLSSQSCSPKRAEPSTPFTLPPSSQRPRIQLRKSDPAPPPQAGWLPVGSSTTFEPGNTCAGQRQLPRLAALETLQQQVRQRKQQQQQQQQRLRRPHDGPAGSSSGTGPHSSTTRMMAAPMQLPPLSEAHRASSNTTSSPTSSPVSRSSSPPSSCNATRLTQQQQQQHYSHHQQQQQQQQQQHFSPPQQQQQQLFHRDEGRRYQLPVPAGMHGAATGGQQHQRWLPSSERRQVPRIEALSSSSRTAAASATPAPPGPVQPRQWETVWSRSSQSPRRGLEQAAFSGSYGDISTIDRTRGETEMGWTQHGGEGLDRSCWQGAREEEGWAMDEEILFRQQQQQRERGDARSLMEVAQQQQQHKILLHHHPEEGLSSRTPSPVSRQHPPPLAATSSARLERKGTAGGWASSAADDRQGSSLAGRTHGSSEWTQAAHSSSNSSSESSSVDKQILQRYLTHLYPKASREVWSHDEEEVLWRAQKEYGNAWSYISGLLPGRSENAVKNHWYTQMRMFIGQRGNNVGSKPCPPPSSKALPAKTMPAKINRQPRAVRRHEEDKADDKQRCCDSSVAAAAALASKASTFPEAADEKSCAHNDDRSESEARAQAVAALGMLFSQGGDTPPSPPPPSDRGDSREFDRIEASSASGSFSSRQQAGEVVDKRLPAFSVGVGGRT